MFNAFINLFCHGDINALKAKFLHTTSWLQHDSTAYGETQIGQLWLQSLQDFGFGELIESQRVNDGEFSALHCKFKGLNNENIVRVAFLFEHNQQYIKRVNSIFDSYRLLNYLQLQEEQLMARYPSPDPLIIAKFDHQLHPKSFHAIPTSICDKLNDTDGFVLDTWWSLWQKQNFPAISQIYSDDCKVDLPTPEITTSTYDLRNLALNLTLQLNRSYCQLEQVIVDLNNHGKIAILWQIDGDFNDNGNIIRIKLPVQSMLTIDNGKIIEESMMIDWHSAMKRFGLSQGII